MTLLSLVISAKICPPLASDGVVLKKNPLSSKEVNEADVAAGEIITIPLGTAASNKIVSVTSEQTPPNIALTPWEIISFATALATEESLQVVSTFTTVIVSPFNKDPDAEASLNAISAESAIAGVRDSIGPVKPKTIPILISLITDVVNIDIIIIVKSNFFIFGKSNCNYNI